MEEGETATFDVGGFWDHSVWQFAGADKPKSAATLNKESIQLVRDKCAWLPKALQDRAVRSEHRLVASVSVKAQLVARHYPSEMPKQKKVRTFTHTDSPDILKGGEVVTFDAGKFVTSILWQLAGAEKRRGEGMINKESIQLIRDKCAWLPTALEKRAAISAARKTAKRKRAEEASTSTAADDDDDDDTDEA